MQTVTLEQWQTKERHGYASIHNGQRHVLALREGGTVLMPVRVVGLDSVSCDICCMEIREGERFSDDGSEVAHKTCVSGWFDRNYGRETLSY